MSEYDEMSRGFVDEMERVVDRLEIMGAQRDALWQSLALLVEYVQRVGGFMEHRDQQILREAMALLEEISKC